MKIGAHHGRGVSETLRLPTMFPQMIRGFLDALADSDRPVSVSTLIAVAERRQFGEELQEIQYRLKGTGFGIC
jgi:hypothetical protein